MSEEPAAPPKSIACPDCGASNPPGAELCAECNHPLDVPDSVHGVVAARITAPAITFPDWGTRRSSWRDHDVTIAGDRDLAGRLLDSINVI